MDDAALLQQIDALTAVVRETAYFNIIVPLLMQLYNRMLERALLRNGYDPARIDITRDMSALEEINPAAHIEALIRRFAALDPAVQTEILQGAEGAVLASMQALDFRRALDDFVQRFGHLSASGNDFSATPWREDPKFVLEMATSTPLSTGNGVSVSFDDLNLPSLRGWALRWIYRRARRYRLYREEISSLYTYGYGLFRNHFLVLGRRLVERGVLACRDDIFYLYLDELRGFVAGRDATQARDLVSQRRGEMERYRNIALPSIIYGDELPPPERPRADGLTGTPTARGYYQGAVCVVRGRQDFGKMTQGAVLVIPFSDVGWSPLFAKAGAVVAESGGMLSHSSIIAREYRIPAVVSVTGACQLTDGAVITVDGYSGRITVHERQGHERQET
jgi:pyruvate,water dikinase